MERDAPLDALGAKTETRSSARTSWEHERNSQENLFARVSFHPFHYLVVKIFLHIPSADESSGSSFPILNTMHDVRQLVTTIRISATVILPPHLKAWIATALVVASSANRQDSTTASHSCEKKLRSP